MIDKKQIFIVPKDEKDVFYRGDNDEFILARSEGKTNSKIYHNILFLIPQLEYFQKSLFLNFILQNFNSVYLLICLQFILTKMKLLHRMMYRRLQITVRIGSAQKI